MDNIDPWKIDRLVFPARFLLSPNSSVNELPFYLGPAISYDEMALAYRNYSITWERVKNAYAVAYGAVLIWDTVYSYSARQQLDLAPVIKSRGCYHHVFNFLHLWPAYGHYLIDYFPVMTVLSDYYRRNAYFIVREKCQFVLDAAPIFGVSVQRLLVVAPNKAIFAINLYMIRPLQMQCLTALFLHKMRNVFAHVWGLDRSIPFRYVFCNRRDRNVTNVQAFLAHVHRVHPDLTIEIYFDELSGRSKETALFFNEMLFVMGYHSSGLFNMIFQQTNTVVMVIETITSDKALFPTLARILSRHCFIHRHPAVGHPAPTRTMNLTGVIPIADRALERAKLIGRKYSPVVNLQPWAGVVLAWDFRVVQTRRAWPPGQKDPI
jgi:hypothetical protein